MQALVYCLKYFRKILEFLSRSFILTLYNQIVAIRYGQIKKVLLFDHDEL